MDSKLYLAENVLNEHHLSGIESRAQSPRQPSQTVRHQQHKSQIEIDTNTSGYRILYEFHRNENAKKPATVHATYVISGIQKTPEPAPTNDNGNDEDEVMASSPYLPSSMPNQGETLDSVLTASIVVVREEDLEDAKATFQSISFIHVYSLEPSTLPDLNVLVDASRENASTHAQDDPLECGKQWGMIQNHNVKRRTGPRPPPAPAAKAPAAKAPAVKPKSSTESTVPAKRPLQKEAPPAKAEASKPDESKSQSASAPVSQASSKASSKPAPSKKGSLFSSFAKAKPKTKAPAAPEPAAQDMVLDDASEGEAEELFPDSTEKAAAANRESRKEREERLKKMMDDDEADDEEMPDVDEEPTRELTPVEAPPPIKPAELKEEVTVNGGRRRGKRQVMKKTTVKDEEGFLVTREEPTWETFSEDEPAPKKPAVNVPKAKAGKPQGQGQGNIMSFFGKK
ncbi:unnamed protein product [Penicillium salamii]|uniref:DNA polymerase delta subunit 3 n=1 Tax=Penicillium salamii TaxID=1612424 RepID=A0A9W4NM05_9EURO|nr:unnamed protein product [Penicillium salamii]CAG8240894.1 unnamed protein product [Penicillium salamii]CAG8379639.1 unnamed protein product [Penicillium salamii]CAG8383402.1 unnamed protein product [Penicillium salamii]CAG8384271.1 unnamed protein product [Penicillium salamii]